MDSFILIYYRKMLKLFILICNQYSCRISRITQKKVFKSVESGSEEIGFCVAWDFWGIQIGGRL